MAPTRSDLQWRCSHIVVRRITLDKKATEIWTELKHDDNKGSCMGKRISACQNKLTSDDDDDDDDEDDFDDKGLVFYSRLRYDKADLSLTW